MEWLVFVFAVIAIAVLLSKLENEGKYYLVLFCIIASCTVLTSNPTKIRLKTGSAQNDRG